MNNLKLKPAPLTIERTEDLELIKSVIADPVIWETVAEDGMNYDNFEPNVMSEAWLVIRSGNEIIALFNIHSHGAITAEIHAHVLPKHRKEFSRDAGDICLQWFYDEFPEYEKLIAQIPVIYENVERFTVSYGFKHEGLNRKCYLKNGEIIDKWLLGITRDELGEYLNEQS